MNSKKKIIFLAVFCVCVLILSFKLVRFYSTHIDILTTTLIEKTYEQEKLRDATCWSTTRQMQAHHLNIKVHPLAAIYQLEATKELIRLFWSSMSKNRFSVLTPKTLNQQLPAEILLKMKMLNLSSVVSKQETHLTQQFQVTEHYRFLLSILFSNSNSNNKSLKLDMPTLDTLDSLSKLAAILSVEILTKSKEIALKNKSKYILPEHILKAKKEIIVFYKIVPNLENKYSIFKFKKLSFDTIKLKGNQLVKTKIKSLEHYNKIDSSLNTAVKKINLLVDIPFKTDALKSLIKTVSKLPDFILYGHKPKPYTEYNLINKDVEMSKNKRFLSLTDVNDSLDILFPVTFLNNADVELYKQKIIRDDNSKKKIILHNYDMDAVRDTGLHWEIINQILDQQDTCAIDPFAQELLAEYLSIYITYIIQHIQNDAHKTKSNIIDEKSISDMLFFRTYWVSKTDDIESFTLNISSKNKDVLFNKYNYDLFNDITTYSKISSVNYLSNIDRGIFTYAGNGVGAADVNNDNYIDLFFAGEGGAKLYINNKDLTFTDKTLNYFLQELPFKDSKQGIFADINNDFLVDLLIIHDNSPSQLWIQEKNNTFKNITKTAGIKTSKLAHCAVFFDFNNDGLLDVFIAHYGPKGLELKTNAVIKDYFKKQMSSAGVVFESEADFNKVLAQSYPHLKKIVQGKTINKDINLDATNGVENQFYVNLGNNTFKEISKEVGLNSTQFSLAAAAVDYNNDGFMDLHVINDFGYDQVYINNKGIKFTEQANELGLADRGNGMNISILDINNDGFFDSYITMIDMFAKKLRFKFPTKKSTFSLDQDILNTSFYLTGNKLFLNNDGEFEINYNDYKFEPAELGWGWGATFFDYENDTDLDVYIANGFIKGSMADKEQNHFFIAEKETFYLVEKGPVLINENSRSVLSLDLNNNGYLDLVVSNYETAPKIFQNMAPKTNHWIKIKLVSTTSNSYAIGAKVSIKTTQGMFNKLVSAGSQYMSQEDTTLTFGLADMKEIQSVSVSWPGGKTIHYKGPFNSFQLLNIYQDGIVKKNKL